MQKISLYYKKKHYGVGIVEALIAILIFTVGIIGVSKLMAVSLRSTQNSESQGRAAILVTDAMERIRILSTTNSDIAKNAFLDGANCSGLSNVNLTDCQLGQKSKSEWLTQVSTTLGSTVNVSICRKPGPESTTCSANTSKDSIIIDMKWKQKIVGTATNKTKDTFIDANYTTSADF